MNWKWFAKAIGIPLQWVASYTGIAVAIISVLAWWNISATTEWSSNPKLSYAAFSTEFLSSRKSIGMIVNTENNVYFAVCKFNEKSKFMGHGHRDLYLIAS